MRAWVFAALLSLGPLRLHRIAIKMCCCGVLGRYVDGRSVSALLSDVRGNHACLSTSWQQAKDLDEAYTISRPNPTEPRSTRGGRETRESDDAPENGVGITADAVQIVKIEPFVLGLIQRAGLHYVDSEKKKKVRT